MCRNLSCLAVFALAFAATSVNATVTPITSILFGSISPCFNEIATDSSGTGSAAVTSLTTAHKVFAAPCAFTTPCVHIISMCPLADKIMIDVYNQGATTAASSTCPWSYLAIA